MESTPETRPTATAMMRFARIKFDRVIPPHILQAINDSYSDQVISREPLLKMAVCFHQSGEPYGVNFRMNNYTLGIYFSEGASGDGFRQGAFMNLPPEVVAYLSHAAEEALAIVQPIVALH